MLGPGDIIKIKIQLSSVDISANVLKKNAAKCVS